MSIFGTLLPYVGRVIGPCDAEGVPAMTEAEVAASHWEVPCWCFAWFGFAGLFPFGEVQPRLVDPANPRQYAKGGL